jgi:hypothetical protein
MRYQIPRNTANVALAVNKQPKMVSPNRAALNYGRLVPVLLLRMTHSAPFQLCSNASHKEVESELKIAASADFIGCCHIHTPTEFSYCQLDNGHHSSVAEIG